MLKLTRILLMSMNFIIGSIFGLLFSIVRPFNPNNSYWFTRAYAFFGLPIIGIKTKVEGLENFPKDKPFIVVANHQSNWDLLIVGSNIPKRTVAIGKKSLKWIPFFGQMFWLGGNVLIDRGNKEEAMKSMKITKNLLLNDNVNIYFFAEGTRNKGKNMLPFKKGAFITAVNAGVPIVRVCVSPYLDNFNMSNIDNGTAIITVLPPIDTKNLEKEDIDGLMKKCHDTMSKTIK